MKYSHVNINMSISMKEDFGFSKTVLLSKFPPQRSLTNE